MAFDILDFSQVNGVVQINQLTATVTGSAGNDTLVDAIEQIIGTSFNDVLSGGHGINVLDGEGGADQFYGNNGDDLMRGGEGDDTFSFSTSDGNDTLLGGSGFDVLDYATLAGVEQVNQLAGTTTGTANNDTLSDIFQMVIGSNFGDVLLGGHGGNSLKGNGGDDQFFANNGDDYMSGGAGSDTFTGGVGDDRQDMGNGEGVDTWLDFTAGGTEDRIVLTFYSRLGSTSFDAAFQARLATVSGHAELTLNGGDKIIFNNVSRHTLLTAADFVFV